MLIEVIAWIDAASRELLLFAGVWMAVGFLDELIVEGLWVWLRLRGRGRSMYFEPPRSRVLHGAAVVFIPCWNEADVIETTLSRCSTAWPHEQLTIFVGAYPNDADTRAAIRKVASIDRRIVEVLMPHEGPTTKADCLNQLYDAMAKNEVRTGRATRFVLLQDAEDFVHSDALDLIDERLECSDFIQLPVIPEIHPKARWIGAHYADEFAENHSKALVVRDWLRTSLPAAGVGCAFRRSLLAEIASVRGTAAPFALEALTEDYELGLLISQLGGRSRFVRALDGDGKLIATHEYFPHTLDAAIRQKARWVHGIAFQGWDRIGWDPRPAEIWMRMRDRRGPLVVIVLLAAYLQIPLWLVILTADWMGLYTPRPLEPIYLAITLIGIAGLTWRLITRAAFTTAQYGWREGVRSIFRQPIGNIITILAGGRAFVAYVQSLRGKPLVWEKTHHESHPAHARGVAQ